MECSVILAHLALLIIFGFQTGVSMKTYNMRRHCGNIVSMMDDGTKSAIIFYQHKSRMRDRFFEMDCTFEISGWRDQDMAFAFLSFNMPSLATTIEIRQGDSWESGEPILGLPRRFSSFSRWRETFYTHWWRMFIRIKGKPPPDGTRIFKMRLNVFHKGPCYPTEFRCNNGRCIDNQLKCNNYNPCGDYSDCQDDNNGQEVAIIVCISVAAVILALLVLCKTMAYFCKKTRRQNQEERSRRRPGTRADNDEEDRNTATRATNQVGGGLSVLYTLIDNSHTVQGSANYNVLQTDVISGIPVENTGDDNISEEEPPSYETIISNDLNDPDRDLSDCDTRMERQDSDDAASEMENLNNPRTRRPRRPTRRHSSRYLPRYSEVLRNRDAYEVRGEDDTYS